MIKGEEKLQIWDRVVFSAESWMWTNTLSHLVSTCVLRTRCTDLQRPGSPSRLPVVPTCAARSRARSACCLEGCRVSGLGSGGPKTSWLDGRISSGSEVLFPVQTGRIRTCKAAGGTIDQALLQLSSNDMTLFSGSRPESEEIKWVKMKPICWPPSHPFCIHLYLRINVYHPSRNPVMSPGGSRWTLSTRLHAAHKLDSSPRTQTEHKKVSGSWYCFCIVGLFLHCITFKEKLQHRAAESAGLQITADAVWSTTSIKDGSHVKQWQLPVSPWAGQQIHHSSSVSEPPGLRFSVTTWTWVPVSESNHKLLCTTIF